MLLALACAQSYAATSEVICDRALRHDVSLEVPTTALTVDVVDHGTSDSILDENANRENAETFRDTSGFAVPGSQRDAIILKRIFNEVEPTEERADDANVSENRIRFRRTQRDDVTADLNNSDIESADDTSDPAREAESSVPDINAHLPGVSLDETLRYRREMYRTDI
jgi:hypothetical protein